MKKNNQQKSILSIIVSYNFIPWIDRCLPSLLGSSQLTDILVVDNASNDDTLASLREQYPQVRVIQNNHNLGFGAANNMGMRIALDEGYDGVLLINQDAWLAPDALQQLVEVSGQHPEYGIVSPIHMTGDGSKLDAGFATYINNEALNTDNSQYSIACCQFINAALWYIPTSVIGKVGLFAPLFYHYGEDKDYVNRLHYHGYQIGYVPTAIGYQILKKIEKNPGLSIGAHYHHERYDGKGYPEGLKGNDIPEIARLIAVADTYDAMTSKRSYRDVLPQQTARNEIEKGVGTQFDPVFAGIMLEMIDDDKEYKMRQF